MEQKYQKSLTAHTRKAQSSTLKSFTWSIPSIANAKKELICHGYIRQNYDEYIAIDILRLFENFYSYDLFTINDITASNFRRTFISPIFQIGSFKAFLEIWPNGCNDENDGECRLFFCFVSIPKKCGITMSYKLSLQETNTHCINHKTFSHDSLYSGWTRNILQNSELKGLKTMTINFQINSLRIGSTIMDIPTVLKSPPATYTWMIEDESLVQKIHTAPNVHGFESPIFTLYGFKWFVTFYPSGARINRKDLSYIFLDLASIQSNDMDIYIKQTISIGNQFNETILMHNIDANVQDTTSSLGTIQDIRKMNRFYIAVQIELIDVYKMDNNDDDIQRNITDTFMKKKDVEIINKELDPSWLQFVCKVPTEHLILLQQDTEYVYHESFEMYKIQWMLTINNRGGLGLSLCNDKYPDIVSVRCCISLRELNIRYVMKGIFDGIDTVSWGEDRMSLEEFKKLKSCTIQLKMQLIED